MSQPPTSARRVATIEGLSELSSFPEIDEVTLARAQVRTVRGRVANHCALAEMVEFIDRKVTIGYDESRSPWAMRPNRSRPPGGPARPLPAGRRPA